ncbi:MAG: hypothetical protein II567_17085 [Candidatus Riflebacteria bacterium]|nr:hypothetical protein [Candidatus Riflebacteria bacterium]
MQIKFTKNEMEKLLELLSIADWVLTSMDVEEDERKDDYLKLLQKLYHEAYESGMTKEIEYDEDAKDYYLSISLNRLPFLITSLVLWMVRI